jgi:hypothetical protein
MSNRKKELLARKYADVSRDFLRMFSEEGKRQGVIYDELSEKYYLDQGTILRIVYSQTKHQKSIQQDEGIP